MWIRYIEVFECQHLFRDLIVIFKRSHFFLLLNRKKRSNKLCFLYNSGEASLNFLHPRNSSEHFFLSLCYFFVCRSRKQRNAIQPSFKEVLQNSKRSTFCQTPSNNIFSLRIKGLQRKERKVDISFENQEGKKLVCLHHSYRWNSEKSKMLFWTSLDWA